MKVAVLGAKGRMGAECVAAINAASDLTLTAALDLGDSLDQLVSSGTEIVVDVNIFFSSTLAYRIFGLADQK